MKLYRKKQTCYNLDTCDDAHIKSVTYVQIQLTMISDTCSTLLYVQDTLEGIDIFPLHSMPINDVAG